MDAKSKRGKTPGSGRQKGTRNKICMNLEALCEETGVDPFKILLEHCKNPDPAISIAAAKECCKFLYPQRKALEVSNPDQGFKVIIEDYVSKT